MGVVFSVIVVLGVVVVITINTSSSSGPKIVRFSSGLI